MAAAVIDLGRLGAGKDFDGLFEFDDGLFVLFVEIELAAFINQGAGLGLQRLAADGLFPGRLDGFRIARSRCRRPS